jgi:uncharacterized protein
MMNQEIIEKLKSKKDELSKKYNIKSIGVFGSYARGEETPESDIDILVEYDITPGFFEFLNLEDELSVLVNKKIDLVTKPALKPLIKDQILQETIYL